MKNKIMVFIPMYNCEKQITRVLNQFTTTDVSAYIDEILIVNNRSKDNGEQAVIHYLDSKKISCKVTLVRNHENYGLGGSHKVAFQYAINNQFDYIIVLHGDDQGSIENLLPYLKSGKYESYDCLLGARFMKGSKLQGYSWFRTFGNYIYNLFISFACRTWIKDLGSGLNMYKVGILKNKFYSKYRDDLVFNVYMLLGSSYFKHKIKFFPITWREDDQVSNVKMVSQAMRTLNVMIKFIKCNKKFLEGEHRDKVIPEYTAELIYLSKGQPLTSCPDKHISQHKSNFTGES